MADIFGTGDDDFISGTAEADFIRGLGGDDIVNGGGGDDVIHGDEGDDQLRGNAGDDQLYGGDGNDLLRGNAGIDYYDGGSNYGFGINGYGDRVSFFDLTATSGVIADLRTGIISNDGFGNVETMVGIESLGGDTAFADTFYGNDGINFLFGSRGDTMMGFGGDDQFLSGGASALVDGGDGTDFLQLQLASIGYLIPDTNGDGIAEDSGPMPDGWFINLATGFALDGFGNTGSIVAVEGVGGTELDDVLIGDGGDNLLLGGDGNDTIRGNAGNDTLDGEGGDDSVFGGDGDDQINGGGGNDLLRGGAGIDTFDGGANDEFSFNGYGDRISFFETTATQGVIADLRTGVISNDGFGNVETMVGIESLGGDTAFADTFYGNDGINTMLGSVGDTMMGFGGDDSIQSSGASALVDGGDGTDFLQLTTIGYLTPDSDGDGIAENGPAMASGWIVDLSTGYVEDGFGDTGFVTAVEGVGGTQYGDTLVGNFADNRLTGGDGDDVLIGLGGNDEVRGEGGHDYLEGNAGNDLLDGGDGNDNLRGFGGSDEMLGGAGDDYLVGHDGDDVIDGGDGWDRAGFSSGATAGVTVDLNIVGIAQDTGQGMDVISGIEHVSGTRFSDVITGDGGDNWLWGGSDGSGVTGNDTIAAGAGNDVVQVGTGDHQLDGGDGNDTLSLHGNGTDITASGVTVSLALQGAAQDTEQGMMNLSGFENLSGSTEDDHLSGDGGDNVLAGESGSDRLSGGAGNDTLLGDGSIGANTYLGGSGPIVTSQDDGGSGNDLLEGGEGDDTLIGGGGNDILDGGAGNDFMVGGTGDDVYFVQPGDGVIENVGEGTDEIRTADHWGLEGTNVENLTAIGSGDIFLGGNEGDNFITGNGGDNYLVGRGGNDTLDGGDGRDVAAFHLPAGTTGTLRVVESGGTFLVQLVQGDGSFEDLFAVNPTGQGSATITGLNSMAYLGTDYVTNVEDLHFFVDAFPAPTPEGQFVNIMLALYVPQSPHFLHVSGSVGDDVIDLAAIYPEASPETPVNANGSYGDDSIFGNEGGNYIEGNQGNDVIDGRGGNDALVGNEGDDALSGNAGDDFIDGGEGHDSLNGGDGNDNFVGGGGNDSIQGGSGDDYIVGEDGSDSVDGGDGHDIVAFRLPEGTPGILRIVVGSGADEGKFIVERVVDGVAVEQLYRVTVTAESATVEGLGSAAGHGTDVVTNYEQLHFYINGANQHVGINSPFLGTSGDDFPGGNFNSDVMFGGEGADGLFGAGGADIIYGEGGDDFYLLGAGGDDYISGGAGHDFINGEAGNDWVKGDAGDDYIRGAGGDDIVDGGEGYDRTGYYHVNSGLGGVSVSLLLQGEWQDTGVAGQDYLVGIEAVSGTPFADTLIGDDAGNWLWGSASFYDPGSGNIQSATNDDTISGGGGDDLIQVGAGNHLLDGGEGSDWLAYNENGAETVGAILSLALQGQAQDTGVGSWTISGFENLDGSGADDHLTGDSGDNILGGSGGNDTLVGGAGNDRLLGDGGAHLDTLGYAGPVTYMDDYGNVVGDDMLEGGDGDDTLIGGGGNDVLDGGAGNDFMVGGTGDDVYVVQPGDAVIENEGEGTDEIRTADHWGLEGTNVENLTALGSGDIFLGGSGSDNVLTGNGGNNYMIGSGGNDQLVGGDGRDIAAFHLAAGTTGSLRVVEASDGSLLVQLVQADGSSQDVFSVVISGAGSATVTGLGPVAHLGTDTVTSIEDLHFMVDTSTEQNQFAFIPLSVTQYESYVAGSAGDDVIDLADYPGANNVGGGLGDDVITGTAGSHDYMRGDQGNDVINGNRGSDFDVAAFGLPAPITGTLRVVAGTADNVGKLLVERVDGETVETLFIVSFDESGTATVQGVNSAAFLGTDTVSGVRAIDFTVDNPTWDPAQFAHILVPGNVSAGNDFTQGSNESDFIAAGDGDDQLRGNNGDDVLLGGDGNDLIRGGSGIDYFDGGSDEGASLFGGQGDRISFFEVTATQGVVADLRTGIISNDGFGNVETMVGIESLGGDTAFADTFYGNDGINTLLGSVGDTMMGFAGDDSFQSSGAAALVDGGDGTDFLQLTTIGYLLPDSNGDGFAENSPAMTSGWIVDLSTGYVEDGFGDTGYVTGIENVGGTDYSDTLVGNFADNQLSGGGGGDTLIGAAGSDTLNGGDGDDTLIGAFNTGFGPQPGDGADILRGEGGNDLIRGGDGDDLLEGGDGNDNLRGDAGSDILDGGAGEDFVSYFFTALGSGITFDARHVGATSTSTIADPLGGTDTLIDIESIGIGGTNFDDILYGSEHLAPTVNWANQMSGNGGNDQMFGASRHDYLDGGAGDDTLQGGAGDDLVIGGEGNDVLIGGPGNDTLLGEAGDDFILAGSGINLVDGGEGNDAEAFYFPPFLVGTFSVVAGSGADSGKLIVMFDNGSTIQAIATVSAAASTVTVTGIGLGSFLGTTMIDSVERLLFSTVPPDVASDPTAPGYVVIDVADAFGLGSVTGGSRSDVILGSDADEALDGGNGSDLISGDGGNDVLIGGEDDDVLLGGSGDDTLDGGDGNDTFDGGSGSDTASYASASGGVTVDLFWQAAFGAAGDDTMVSVENAIGSDHDDALIGDGGDNQLSGNAGHDHLFGAAGNDSLLGGTGDDYLIGGAGDDLLDGGEGFDRAGYSSGATAGVTVNLNLQGVAQNTGRGMDVLIGIEHVSGTRFDDVITGDGGDNWLWGGSDGSGVTGNDIISAGAGNDLVDVGTGNHSLDGGSGIDTLSLDGNGTDITAAGVTLSLLLQGSAQNSEQGMMTLNGFENLSGSLYDDQLTGDGGNNVLAGYAGADTLTGGAGNDVLLGDGIVTVDTHDTGRSGPIITIEDVDANASDLLDGGSGNDRLIGGGGADQLRGGSGADTFAFLTLSDSSTGASDLILDFSGRIAMTTNSKGRPIRGLGEGDKIDLSAIDANINLEGDQSFTLVDFGFSGVAGEMFASYDSSAGRTSLYLDVDGDAVADMTIDFSGQVPLTGADFIF